MNDNTVSYEEVMQKLEWAQKNLERVEKELAHAVSDNQMLKDTVIRMAMQLMGVRG